MEFHEKERAIARIVAGMLRFRMDDFLLLIKQPNRLLRYEAQEVYEEVYRDAYLRGLYTDDELIDFMINEGLWDTARQELMDKLPKEIEDFKVKLFEATFKSEERKTIRKYLAKARDELSKLNQERNTYSFMTCSGAATLARTRFLVKSGLTKRNGKPVRSTYLVDQALNVFAHSRIPEENFRELARTEPWRVLWSSKKTERSFFGVAVVDFTEEQSKLANYSLLFDSIYEHPECPGEDVIADDDLLDGWLILQRRKRESDKGTSDVVTNEKVRSSDEIFLIAETVDDARKVETLNSGASSTIKKQRMAYLKQHGEVNELEMPDTKQRLMMEANQKFAQQVKG